MSRFRQVNFRQFGGEGTNIRRDERFQSELFTDSRVESIISVLFVDCTKAGIDQDLVGRAGLGKFLFTEGSVRLVSLRVELDRGQPVRFLDVLFLGVPVHAENLEQIIGHFFSIFSTRELDRRPRIGV